MTVGEIVILSVSLATLGVSLLHWLGDRQWWEHGRLLQWRTKRARAHRARMAAGKCSSGSGRAESASERQGGAE